MGILTNNVFEIIALNYCKVPVLMNAHAPT
jgi:hypothetical protein